MTDDVLLALLLYGLVVVATFGLAWSMIRWLYLGRHLSAILDRLLTTAAYDGDRTAVEDELAAHKREETRRQHDYMVWLWVWLFLSSVALWYSGTIPWFSVVTLIGWTGFCIWKW